MSRCLPRNAALAHRDHPVDPQGPQQLGGLAGHRGQDEAKATGRQALVQEDDGAKAGGIELRHGREIHHHLTVRVGSEGIEFGSLAELAEHPAVIAEIDRGLEDAMSGFNNAERVKKVKVLGEEWLPDSEMLTPTSKLKRRGIFATYQDEIEALYN